MLHKSNPLKHRVTFNTEGCLHISVESERLIIRSIQASDEKGCIALFGDPGVMEKFAAGKPYDEEKVKSQMEAWTMRWKARDPFGCYAILDKSSGEFIGMIGIGHSAPGESELFYLLNKKFWGQGIGKEAAQAVIQTLIPRLMLRHYEVDHKSLKKLVATARLDNPASQNIITGVGFKEEAKVYKFEAWRFSYNLFAKQVKNDYHRFFNRLDSASRKQKRILIKDKGVDISDEKMADSVFGQRRKGII